MPPKKSARTKARTKSPKAKSSRPAAKPTGYEMHVISNTHWDREWRLPFQKNRMMLVDVMDTLLRILDRDPNYRCYHLDSQTVMLEDYLAIRPETRDKLADYIRQGRIMAGPWYTAPDMNLISGESIVRNLLLGHKQARAFGAVMKVGYTPFSFGQIAQLPQIYAGFGIDTILTYRGLGRDRAKAEFWWEAPDGTRALASQFSRMGRYNFYFHVYRPVVDGRQVGSDLKWAEIDLPVRSADVPSQFDPIYAVDQPDTLYLENAGPGIKALRDQDSQEFTTRHLLLMQGCDTTAPNPDEPRIIAECDAALENDHVFHSTLPDYMKALKKAVGDDLPVLSGEMRIPARVHSPAVVLLDAISARIYLKQENTRAQTRIERWSEPASVLAWRYGMDYPAPFLEQAWKYILANQAHDSLAGCGLDEVHDDMLYRWEQVRQLSEEITRRSLSRVVRQIDASDLPDDGSLVTVWNSLPTPRSEVVAVTIDFPRDQNPKAFSLRDENGAEIPVQFLNERPFTASVQLRADWPQLCFTQRHTALIEARNLPGLGYRAFQVIPLDHIRRNRGSQLVAPNAMENAHLRVQVNPNGTLDVTHKPTGRTYANLHSFDDSGEVGTPWEREMPRHDRVVTSLGAEAEIAVELDGPLATTFSIRQTLRLPATSDVDRRSDVLIDQPIVSRVTLRKDSPLVEIETAFDNVTRDHRLRACFPTHLQTDVSDSDAPFDVTERPIPLPDSSQWLEPARGNHPQLSWVDLSDGDAGLAVLSDGLPEYAVSDDPSRTLALTLVRGMREVNEKFAFPPPRHEGTQSLGPVLCRYALCPHAGDWRRAELPALAARHNTPLRAMQSGRHEVRHGETLPWTQGFIDIEGRNLTLSAIKKAEARNSVIVRLFNPDARKAKARLRCHWPLKAAHAVTLEEKRIAPLPLADLHTLTFDLPKKKILSLELVFK